MSSNIVHVSSGVPAGAPAAADKNPFLMALGERVRALRARRGMTRKAVA
ncbi:MAG: transcriptional regulator, partial [Burkholderiaceae bacterium]|nr:transcriptional regulator [Burkholderiaceae bacterium]